MTDRDITRVEIDPNVRSRGNQARVGFEDAAGPLRPHQTVQLYERESGLTGTGTISEVDTVRRLAWIRVDWSALRVPTAPEIRDAEVLAAVETKLAAARHTTCGHDITEQCGQCTTAELTLRTELAATLAELQLAVAHDRQPYPTPAAYTAACAAIGRHSERADRAEEDARRLGAQYTEAMSGANHLADKLTRVRAMIATVREEYTQFGKEAERTVALSVTDDVLEVLDAKVVYPGTEQPVSGPQHVDQPEAHGGQVVHTVPMDWSGAGGIFASLLRKYPNAYPETTTKEN